MKLPKKRGSYSPMRKILTVAWREFRDTALTKAFLFGAVIMPIFMIGLFIVVVPFLDTEDGPLQGTVAIIGPVDVVAELEVLYDSADTEIQELLEKIPDIVKIDPMAKMVLPKAPAAEIEIEVFGSSQLVDLKKRVQEGDFLACILVPEGIVNNLDTKELLEVFIPNEFSPDHTNFITSKIEKAVVNARLKRQGHDPIQVRSLLKQPKAYAMRIQEDGEVAADNKLARTLLPMAFMMLLWIAAFTSGNYLLTTTIEEKSNKVIEVLLSAISPMQLLTGKILGQAGVSAVILAMYGFAAIVGLFAFAMMDLVTFSQLGLFLIYFVMGYFMIATMMVAVGSAVSELSDAQSLMGPMMLIMIIPFMLMPILTEHPHGIVAVASSYIPPLIPFVMIIRITATTEPIMMWEILLSIVVGYLSVFCMIWMAARIFRIGILLQGKPPNILQLVRWIRQG
ncbi:MAG: ABC transporter permease [Phycisphaerales bacterium]